MKLYLFFIILIGFYSGCYCKRTYIKSMTGSEIPIDITALLHQGYITCDNDEFIIRQTKPVILDSFVQNHVMNQFAQFSFNDSLILHRVRYKYTYFWATGSMVHVFEVPLLKPIKTDSNLYLQNIFDKHERCDTCTRNRFYFRIVKEAFSEKSEYLELPFRWDGWIIPPPNCF